MKILTQNMVSFTAIIRKGEKQFVALCPEVDVVSQGYTVEESLANLKEAVELYLEVEGMPEDKNNSDILVVKFDVKTIGKVTKVIRQRSH